LSLGATTNKRLQRDCEHKDVNLGNLQCPDASLIGSKLVSNCETEKAYGDRAYLTALAKVPKKRK
jgi:hypothetical protein